MRVAFDFAFRNPKKDQVPVIFVFICSNYLELNGLLMNNEAWTAYPSEGEMLLMEGIRMYVFDIEYDHVVENMHEGMEFYNGKKITIIYLKNW